MDHIEEELRRLADTDPIVESYFKCWDGEFEYPVAKNLERAQGDERDIIREPFDTDAIHMLGPERDTN